MANTRRHNVGRTREKLARLLQEAINCTVDPADLNTQRGFYAQSGRNPALCRWYGRATRTDGRSVQLACWDTMRDCVLFGLDVIRDDGFTIEVCSKSPTPSPSVRRPQR